MEKEIRIVDKEVLEDIINTVKTSTDYFLAEQRLKLIIDSMEKRSIEDNLQLIKETEKIKEEIFLGCLDCYNAFLKDKNLISSFSSKEISQHKMTIEIINHDMKKTGIITVGVTLLLPKLAPIALVISLPLLGLDSLGKKISKEIVDLLEKVKEYYESSQKEFFELIDNMRTDYHQSKKEFKELKQKAKAGEEIIDDLLKMLQPERIGLALPEEASNMNDESRKVYTK